MRASFCQAYACLIWWSAKNCKFVHCPYTHDMTGCLIWPKTFWYLLQTLAISNFFWPDNPGLLIGGIGWCEGGGVGPYNCIQPGVSKYRNLALHVWVCVCVFVSYVLEFELNTFLVSRLLRRLCNAFCLSVWLPLCLPVSNFTWAPPQTYIFYARCRTSYSRWIISCSDR